MSKRKSALELAILNLEDQIAALEIARNHLIRLRITKAPPKATPRPVTPRSVTARDAERLQARSLERLTQRGPEAS